MSTPAKAVKPQPTVGSLFSGVEGFGLGFEQAGFEVLWQVEKEPFCLAVLKTHFPSAERFTDVRDVGKHNLRAVDVVTGGFPCQDLSVAGKRAGLAGARSGLFWELTRILGELRPPWIVIENVPGLFSSNDGEDFATVIRELGNIGYGVAWRVLDSQYFGVAQRRRRVFIVGSFGKPCPAEVLFKSEGGEGDFAESGKKRPELAFEIAASLRGVGGGPRGFNLDAEQGLAVTCLESGQANASIGHGIVPNLTCLHEAPIVNIASLSGLGSGGPDDNDAQAHRIIQCAPADPNGVRDFASLPEGMDSARYRALGNAVTASVAQWIATRIKESMNEANS